MNAFIIGSGRTGSELAKMLSRGGHNVVVIDSDPEAFKKLGSVFNGLQVAGSGTDEILLREIKAQDADVFAALTDKDNINLMAAQIAKTIFGIPKVIAKVNDPAREKAFRNQGISLVSGTHLVSVFVWNEISDKPYRIVSTFPPDTQIVRFNATQEIVGRLVEELNSGAEFMVCGIIHRGRYHMALPGMEIKPDDELVAVVKTSFLPKLEEML